METQPAAERNTGGSGIARKAEKVRWLVFPGGRTGLSAREMVVYSAQALANSIFGTFGWGGCPLFSQVLPLPLGRRWRCLTFRRLHGAEVWRVLTPHI